MSEKSNRRSFIQAFGTAAAGTAGAAAVTNGSSRPSLAQAPGSLPFTAESLSKAGRSFINPDKVLLWENTRKEIRELLEGGQLKAAILPTGSIEQHNEHMAMVADVANATLISQQAALQLFPQVIVAPPSPCGYAPYHMARKGTITLRKETFQAYVFDVMESLKAHGIRTILVLNGHGGNHQPLQEALPEWRTKLGINIDADSYWSGTPQSELKTFVRSKQLTSHAGEFETSIYKAAFPGRLRPFTMEEYDDAKLNYESDFSPEVEEFLRRDRRSFKDGEIDLAGENGRDRRRQEEALLAHEKTGEIILTRAINFVVDKMQTMIAATEADKS
ncbi:MAG: creatininase family protein [Fuerstiella sp.]|nr:creatininase family protein [Fuerstiella sp.]